MSDPYSSQNAGSQSQSSQRRSRRPRCEQCGSRRFRRDPGTSLVICESGHVLQGFRDEETQDGDEFNTSNRTQMHRRSIKVQGSSRGARVGRKRMSVAAKGVWSGARARYLYYQCLQLVLRMQIQALRHEMPELPAEIEPICRDLWALHVSLKVDLVPQPHLGSDAVESRNDSENQSRNAKRAASSRRAAQAERDSILDQEQEESEALQERLREVGVLDEREDATSQSDVADQWASSEWESALDQDSEEDDKSVSLLAPRKRSQRGRRRTVGQRERQEGRLLKKQSRDGLDNTLCILHLALITLRIPVTWCDLCTLIRSGKLPYLNIVHQLPAEMVQPFPSREVRKLDPSHVPTVINLHRRTVKVAADLYDSCGIEFPELNSLPILWRCVERLLLPPTFYTAAKRLLAYIDIPMHTVPSNSASCPHRVDGIDEGGQRGMRPGLDARLAVTLGKKSTAREVVLVAAVVLVAKLRFGLDGEQRFESTDDSAIWSGTPALPEWMEALEAQQQQMQSDVRAAYDVQGLELQDMEDMHLDAYLDYAERTLILTQRPSAYHWRRRDGINDLLSCAPLLNQSLEARDMQEQDDEGSIPLRQKKSFVHERRQALYAGDAYSPTDPPPPLSSHQLRPGDAHSIYLSEDDSQPLPRSYARLLHHASQVVGCQEADVADAVQAIEIGLIKTLIWRRKSREDSQRQREREKGGKRRPGRPHKVQPRE